FFGRVRIAAKRTYNASATPTFETATVMPRPLAPAEIEALRAAMQALVAPAEQHEGAALRKRIATLEQELHHRPLATRIERVEVPVIEDEQLHRLEQVVSARAETGQQLVAAAQEIAAALARVSTQRAVPSAPSAPATTRPVRSDPAPAVATP